jgi:hypothetical protein
MMNGFGWAHSQRRRWVASFAAFPAQYFLRVALIYQIAIAGRLARVK